MLFACYFPQINQNKNIWVGIHKQERIIFLFDMSGKSDREKLLVWTERFMDSWSRIEDNTWFGETCSPKMWIPFLLLHYVIGNNYNPYVAVPSDYE